MSNETETKKEEPKKQQSQTTIQKETIRPNAATHSENTAKHCAFEGNILTLALKLRERGLSESFLATMIRALNEIGRNASLDSPSEVSLYIAKKKAMDSFKANLCDFYKHYADFYGLVFVKPRYHRDHRLPQVPTTEELSLIISHANRKYALIYSILRDTGLRPIEVSSITPNDIDLEKGYINILSAKHGKPRIVKVKPSTLAMLKEYIQRNNLDIEARLFPSSGVISNTFARLRTSIARKLQNPRIRRVRLYDFRHYFATSLYYETKDLLLTKEMLGHRNINNTMVYTHLVRLDTDEKYNVATARTVEEATKLIENGYEFIHEYNSIMIYRKRK